jgi:hypothetical protein
VTWPGAWPSFELVESRRSLVALREATTAEGIDDTYRAYLAKLLAVRAAGHIEFTLDTCLHQYAQAKAHERIADYVRAHLFRGRGVTPRKIVEKVRWFDAGISDHLEELMKEDDEYLKRELSFLIDKRNKIAHGQSDGVGATKAADLAAVSIRLGDWLVAQIDPTV